MSYREILRLDAFRNLWLGQCISQLGDSFYFIVFIFMVKKVTGSDAMVGWVAAVELLPYLLLSPYAGVAADRFDRKKVMLWSDYGSAIVLVTFAALVMTSGGKPPVWSIFVTAASLSTIRAFFMPAKNASIPRVVPAESLLAANALSMAAQNSMPLLALTLSAGVLATLYAISPTWFFLSSILLNATSFLGSAVFIAKLPSLAPEAKEEAHAPAAQEFKLGLRYLKSRPELKVLVLVTMLLNLMISPFIVVHVAANDRWYGGKPQTLAWFEAAFFMGMVLGSAVVGRLKIVRPGLSFIFGLAACGLTVVAMAYSRTFWPYFLWNLAAGLAVPFSWIPMPSYVQATVPDEFRGRVNAVLNMAQMGVQPLGMGVAGILIDRIGLMNMFLLMGFGMVGACLTGLASPRFVRARMPASASPPEGTPEPAIA